MGYCLLIGMCFVFTADFISHVFRCACNCCNLSRMLMMRKCLSKEGSVKVEQHTVYS